MTIYNFLAVNGQPPRTSPDLQRWMTALADQIAGDAAAWVYAEAAADPANPADLDAVWPVGGMNDEGSIVLWYNTVSGWKTLYFLVGGIWIEGPQWGVTTTITADNVEFTPTTSADWDDPTVADTQEALDNLADVSAHVRQLNSEQHFLCSGHTRTNANTQWKEIAASNGDNIYLDVTPKYSVVEIVAVVPAYTVSTWCGFLIGEWNNVAASAPIRYPDASTYIPDGGGLITYGNERIPAINTSLTMMARFSGLTPGATYRFATFMRTSGASTGGYVANTSVSLTAYDLIKA